MTAPKRSRAQRQALAEFTDRTFALLFQGVERAFDEHRSRFGRKLFPTFRSNRALSAGTGPLVLFL